MARSAPTVSQHGLVNPGAAARHFQLSRHDPSPDLAPFVERHWIVRWDLRGRQPFVQELLPHPVVNLVFERAGARVHGVGVRRSQHFLAGSGQVFGTKFKIGGFFPFVGRRIAELTARSVPLQAAFGRPAPRLLRAVLASSDPSEQIGLVEGFLREELPAADENVERVGAICRLMLEDRSLTRVEDLGARVGMEARPLQRLFARYVGVTPKFVLRRYRLHEAAARLASGADVSWAALALELGYFDQAHFIKDFTALVGSSPARYAAACRRQPPASAKPVPARTPVRAARSA